MVVARSLLGVICTSERPTYKNNLKWCFIMIYLSISGMCWLVWLSPTYICFHHCLLLLPTSQRHGRWPTPFWFMFMWSDHPSFLPTVEPCGDFFMVGIEPHLASWILRSLRLSWNCSKCNSRLGISNNWHTWELAFFSSCWKLLLHKAHVWRLEHGDWNSRFFHGLLLAIVLWRDIDIAHWFSWF